ncbi:hypothetical protein MLD38_014009 [Melastoma candidum]|uniref:Uncharacterized protein n=1 Tax=Melastoma candidum TaxID=119954 RepID=A0ACB9RCJ4_9MYRT|nr:hypothetical protein MLD38_014009 [Melastoma candidum]
MESGSAADQQPLQSQPEAAEDKKSGDDAAGEEEEEEALVVGKAQSLMDKITASPDTPPNPRILHALSSLVEAQESRFLERADSSSANARASHAVGRLGNLIRDNDEFFELISSKYLSEARYSPAVQAAAVRLLMGISSTWTYPHVFEDATLDNLKRWAMEDGGDRFPSELARKTASDFEMLKTYSTGLLAASLSGGAQLVEDVLTCGLSAKLMRYLRLRVLGESTQRDSGHGMDNKTSSSSRGRARQPVDVARFDDSRRSNERPLEDQICERNQDGAMCGQTRDRSRGIDVQPPDKFGEGPDSCDGDAAGDDRWNDQDSWDEEVEPDFDDISIDDSSRRKLQHGLGKAKGKGWTNEARDQNKASPGSGSHLGIDKVSRGKNSSRQLELKRVWDAQRLSSRLPAESLTMDKDEYMEFIGDCKVGTKDFSDLVKEAVKAAEAEARKAQASAEAIKAATAAAAEVVKSAAIEEYKKTSNEDAAVLAASKAASTVIEAAITVEASRNAKSAPVNSAEQTAIADTNEEITDYFILDKESLAQLREKYCIQCLEILGEYIEVLGPVLHEKGVDVCLALLQRSSCDEPKKIATLLPDVMKLICALAAHRKFAALFVDRGGIQKLLAVPRVEQTFFGLSSCLFTIGSLQGIMERVCALPSEMVRQVVELGIQILDCPQDQAKKNSAIFFSVAFVFRAILDAFDAQDGLQKLLGILNEAASVRSGVTNASLGIAGSASLRHDRSPAEVLTSSEKQIAYHTCVALRQYFRAHFLLIVDSIRPTKTYRNAPRSTSSTRAVYKPLDLSNEAIDAVFLLLQKDRKLGPAFVRVRWPIVDRFLASNGHVTMLELCQAPPVERYLHDLLQYALGVLHIVSLIPQSRKMIVNATLTNGRLGIAVILDAANIASTYVDPEIIQPALNVLINLVCPPPSISNRPPMPSQNPLNVSSQPSNGLAVDTREKSSNVDRVVCMNADIDPRERNGDASTADRGASGATTTQSSTSQSSVSATNSGLVGDRRISLGAGAGSAGLAAQLEQGYRQARDAVRANNGIKVLLHLLQPRVYSPPAALDCIRALACRVLLGLARDDTIAHILTKLQVGKKLSELIRDTGSQTLGNEQGRWQAELAQVAIELISILTNSGRASTLAATDAATPTLRRIERAAIAAATPITYHARELLLLIHEHLQASGLVGSAALLLKEAQLTPLSPSLSFSTSGQESSMQIQWPSGRSPGGFLLGKAKTQNENLRFLRDFSESSSKKKSLAFSPALGLQSSFQAPLSDVNKCSGGKLSISRRYSARAFVCDSSSEHAIQHSLDDDTQCKTPIILPLKRKHSDLKDSSLPTSGKRLQTGEHGQKSPVCVTPSTYRKSSDPFGFFTPHSGNKELYMQSCGNNLSEFSASEDGKQFIRPIGNMSSTDHGYSSELHSTNTERLTLDSLVVQYLKHLHRQCPAPVTTLPPLSLLHPHVCPEPKRSLDAPSNVTARLGTREFRKMYGGVHGNRKDRQFIFSRFRPWRTCRDDTSVPLTCMAFLADSSHIAVGSHAGELKIFDTNSNGALDSCLSHQSPVMLIESSLTSDAQLLLSSSIQDVRLWDATSISSGPWHSFEGCKAARFSHSGSHFAALSSNSSVKEILLYDIQTYQVELRLSDTSTGFSSRGNVYPLIHFSPSDTMLLWNGVLWDRRVSGPVHRFDQLTDYGGGGFHPAGNEVIVNSEVWDLRKYKLLRSVPSLNQTSITFNGRGDIIYAVLRRNLEDVMSAVHTRRAKNALFSVFQTIDAVNYSDIATVPVDRCVLDLATEPTDSCIGLITLDDQEEMISSARIYEIGRRRPTDDDSDRDDAETEDDEDDDDDDDEDASLDPILGTSLDGDSDSDPDNMSYGDNSVSDLDEDDDGDFVLDELEFDDGTGMLEIVTEGDEDDDDGSQMVESFSSGDEEELLGDGFRF